MDWITDGNAWAAFASLAALEVVLGIDNIVFISILTQRLRPEQRTKARNLGLGLALVGRLGLLLAIRWIMGLEETLFSVAGHRVSGRDAILIAGGFFLIYKSTKEIHHKLEIGDSAESGATAAASSFASVLTQILLLDLVFSLDSVITAVGMVDDLGVMVAAILVAMSVMLFAARVVSEFVMRHPSVKMLALAFLLMIGLTLVAEGGGTHVPKGYIYSAMAFSIFVEMLNLRSSRSKRVAPKTGKI